MTNLCSIKDCRKQARNRGWCSMHYARWKRHGDPTFRKFNYGEPWIDDHGYRQMRKDGKTVREHRDVIEQLIGRTLHIDEVVHHIDGNRLNNAPSNLKVMSRGLHTKEHQSTTFRNETHKQCTQCREIKPRRFFGRVRNSGKDRDPHKPACNACLYKIKMGPDHKPRSKVYTSYECAQCRKRFVAWPKRRKGYAHVFCSVSCSTKYWRSHH